MIEKIGFRAKICGKLTAAHFIENLPLTLFPEWQKPTLISTLIFVFFYIFSFGRNYLCVYEGDDVHYGWNNEEIAGVFLKVGLIKLIFTIKNSC